MVSRTSMEWIDVRDGLPGSSGDVLVWAVPKYESSHRGKLMISSWNGISWLFCDDLDITHWMDADRRNTAVFVSWWNDEDDDEWDDEWDDDDE